MESGNKGADTRIQHEGRVSRFVGLAMVAAAVLLLVGSGLYYGYGVYARDQLYRLNYSVHQLHRIQVPPQETNSGLGLGQAGLTPDTKESLSLGSVDEPRVAVQKTEEQRPADQHRRLKHDSVYPLSQMHPKYWDQPFWAGVDGGESSGLPEGYQPISADGVSLAHGAGSQTRRIRIPAIGVDSDVGKLGILELGDSRAYETPKNIVGHIPGTAEPGERGNVWLFGHLESPVRGEGDVFRKLPQIPNHLRNGDPVYVALEDKKSGYLYRVTDTRVVHEDDLVLYDADYAAVTLVTCVPKRHYDHRLLVTARLVGVKSFILQSRDTSDSGD